MPLSEDEQRILQQIEQQLYESDPALVREVSQTTLWSHAFRNLKWATLGFLVGVAVMVTTLSTSYLLSFGGFVIMLVSALYFEHNARRLGRAGLEQVTRSMRSGGLGGAMSEKMRERFRRGDAGGERDV